MRISVGNPHLACLVDAPAGDDDWAAPPELDPVLFPDGANVELVRLTGERSAQMSVYERGSGPPVPDERSGQVCPDRPRHRGDQRRMVPLGPSGRDSVQGLTLPSSLVRDYQQGGVFAVLGARTFHGTTDRGRLLARAHPSGSWVEWLSP